MTQGTHRTASHAGGRVRTAGIVLCLASAMGCGPGGQAIDVTLSGLTADVDRLEAEVQVPSFENLRFEVRSPLDRFIVEVSRAHRGPAQVRVAGQRGDGCRVSLGRGQLELLGEQTSARYVLSVALAPVSDGCAVQIDRHGDGSGRQRNHQCVLAKGKHQAIGGHE